VACDCGSRDTEKKLAGVPALLERSEKALKGMTSRRRTNGGTPVGHRRNNGEQTERTQQEHRIFIGSSEKQQRHLGGCSEDE
jgi:hypothetical protein